MDLWDREAARFLATLSVLVLEPGEPLLPEQPLLAGRFFWALSEAAAARAWGAQAAQ